MEKRRGRVIHQKRALQERLSAPRIQKEKVGTDNWGLVKKHPITKVVLVIGVL